MCGVDFTSDFSLVVVSSKSRRSSSSSSCDSNHCPAETCDCGVVALYSCFMVNGVLLSEYPNPPLYIKFSIT